MARSGRNPDDYHAQLCIFERHRKDVLSILANQATAHTVVEQAELELIEQECSKLATLLARVNYLVAILRRQLSNFIASVLNIMVVCGTNSFHSQTFWRSSF